MTAPAAAERFRTPFGFASTAAEVLAGVDLSGQRAIVTGGAAGIGLETSRALAAAGASVTVAVRRPEAARDAIAALGLPEIAVRPLDLADLRSVAAFVADWTGPCHILVANAGIMAVPTLERTAQGHELQFGTNYLGHFALAVGMRGALAAAGGARLVSVSSSGHLFAPVLFDDPGFAFIPYDPILAYGQSKTAKALLAVAIARRWRDDGITANALHPGAIATGLQQHTGGLRAPAERRKTVAQGAATSVLLAGSPLLAGVSGRYFEDGQQAAMAARRDADLSGVAPYALDTDNAERLWALSLRAIAG